MEIFVRFDLTNPAHVDIYHEVQARMMALRAEPFAESKPDLRTREDVSGPDVSIPPERIANPIHSVTYSSTELSQMIPEAAAVVRNGDDSEEVTGQELMAAFQAAKAVDPDRVQLMLECVLKKHQNFGNMTNEEKINFRNELMGVVSEKETA